MNIHNYIIFLLCKVYNYVTYTLYMYMYTIMYISWIIFIHTTKLSVCLSPDFLLNYFIYFDEICQEDSFALVDLCY